MASVTVRLSVFILVHVSMDLALAWDRGVGIPRVLHAARYYCHPLALVYICIACVLFITSISNFLSSIRIEICILPHYLGRLDCIVVVCGLLLWLVFAKCEIIATV